ncbi:MAG TPA: YihY/virulence factor BrkB family protein [Flavisolibacter sp.]|jgi:membrane protein|nr:YihY/virulence factor BrkB family protein [Flavisolibacter sp.]
MKKFSFGLVWLSLKESFKEFGRDKVTKLSASLAYYTVFSLAPLLVLIISISGLIFGQHAVEGNIENQISSIVGPEAAVQVQEMIKNASLTGQSTMATIISAAVLIFSATTIFGELQDSINSIWGLRKKESAGIMAMLKTRLLSFGLIASLGFILMVSLIATTVLAGLGNRLQEVFPNVSFVLFYILNLALTLSVITMLFAVIFKVLPDVKMRWGAVIPGSITTAILFMIGKMGISFYINKSDLGSSFGAASSLAIILVWVYYSSIILYFGAEFTKAYATHKGEEIVPDQYVEWDERPAMPGATPKKAPTAKEPSTLSPAGRSSRNIQPPAPQLAVHGQPVSGRDRMRELGVKMGKEKDQPGMGKTLFGLALYFATKGKKDRNKR